MASVKVKCGTEGPAHDPYSYTDITFYFTNPRRKPVIYHSGLCEWVHHGKRHYSEHGAYHPAEVFEQLTGMSVYKARQIPGILEQRMLRALPPKQRWAVIQCMEADAEMLRWAK